MAAVSSSVKPVNCSVFPSRSMSILIVSGLFIIIHSSFISISACACLMKEEHLHHSLDFVFDICYNQGASLICKYHYAVACSRRRLFYLWRWIVLTSYLFGWMHSKTSRLSTSREQSCKMMYRPYLIHVPPHRETPGRPCRDIACPYKYT